MKAKSTKQSDFIRTGGGKFDPKEENVYFVAGDYGRLGIASNLLDHILIAVNELKRPVAVEALERWLQQGKSIFLDSGIFWLTNEHKRKHGITMDEALALAPDQIDGFQDLLALYVTLIERFGDRSWGYIELDQGGRDNKIKTRAMLEAKGLRPIPVYHPFNDGWDYFDHLAQRYDRICFGNVVQADAPTRKRLIATAWERSRKYPGLWIHVLGYTPNQLLNAYPINSGDSSSWLSVTRWSGYKPRAMGAGFGEMPKDFQYNLDADPHSPQGHIKGAQFGAYGTVMQMRNWRTHLQHVEANGFDLHPPKP